MIEFCTIITRLYLPVAKALLSSLQKHFDNPVLHVLIVDYETTVSDNYFKIYNLSTLSRSTIFGEIRRKYEHTGNDQLRWALKPVLISHLLETGIPKVFYTDPDIYFVGNGMFLKDLLQENNLLLSPHWPDTDIVQNPDSVISVLKGGLYNAGFIAANRDGLNAIRWWASMCHFKMGRLPYFTIYDDQKYLDLLPVLFDKVFIIKHQGCNLAAWNIHSCKRELIDGRLLINKKYDPVFIHFTRDTILNILGKNDALLRPYLDDYIRRLSDNGFDLLKNLEVLQPGNYDSALYRLKHKLRFRTRLKKMLYKLAEKL